MGLIRNISSSSLSDAELVALYKKTGDQQVVADLFQRYMDLVYGVCLKYLKHPENAQDSSIAIYEELVVKLAKHEVDYFKGWLYTLSKNHCLMRLRSEKRNIKVNYDVELVQSQEEPHLNGVLEKEENFRKLEFCIEQLQPDQKQAIQLFYLQGKCYNEISEVTGLEWNKVRSFIQNGRRNLKNCMESQKAQSIAENDTVIRK